MKIFKRACWFFVLFINLLFVLEKKKNIKINVLDFDYVRFGFSININKNNENK